MKFFDFSSGQASGPDFGDIFLPSIVGGIYLGSKVFIEANYMLGIGTIGIGYYFPTNNLYMEGMMIECEEDYKFNSSYDFYTDLNAGLLFFSRSMFSITLELTYQLRYPKVKYRKFINYSTVGYGKPLIPVEYSESVNLSMLLWSIGIQVNL